MLRPATAAPARRAPAAWAELLADALVGTDRRTHADPADLLDQSAAWAAFRRAGTRPAVDPGPRPASAAPETRPLVGDPAARRLIDLLDGGGRIEGALRDAVLHEWLELVRDRGRRVPPELLPALLSCGRQHARLRPIIVDVGGARLHWLAEQNPEWTHLTRDAPARGASQRAVVSEERTLGAGTGGIDAADPQVFQTGTHAQRRGYLGALRRQDPGAARALLTGEWATLAAPERADLLATLATGLGPEDEPLLESGLDDRRREVRTVAADLLAVLPGSAYQTRAAQRARRYLSVGGPRGSSVEIRLPDACDETMRRDGIAAKPPAKIGERAWWLEEVLARAPLSTWPSPAVLLSRLRGSEWAATVHRGLARAAAAHGDATWATALVDALDADAQDRELAAHLYTLLPGDQIVSLAARALSAGTVALLGPLLENCPRPWPPELARLVLSGLTQLAQRRVPRGQLHQLARLAAVRLPVTTAAEARELAQSLHEVEGVDALPFERLAETLSFRYEMTQEIA